MERTRTLLSDLLNALDSLLHHRLGNTEAANHLCDIIMVIYQDMTEEDKVRAATAPLASLEWSTPVLRKLRKRLSHLCSPDSPPPPSRR